MKLRLWKLWLGFAVLQANVLLCAAGDPRDQLFDAHWRFLRAEAPAFDDAPWRTLDVPHDWSIEDLPPKEGEGAAERVGPFDPAETQNRHFTGNTVGGVGWYRKHFTLPAASPGQRVAVRFDGVYMNGEFWLNGRRLGEHPHGYTSFEFDLTPLLNPPGQENVLAVRVRNEGKNSRWYSGSGIYRHVWLTTTEPLHAPTWGVFVSTPEVSISPWGSSTRPWVGRCLPGSCSPTRPTAAASSSARRCAPAASPTRCARPGQPLVGRKNRALASPPPRAGDGPRIVGPCSRPNPKTCSPSPGRCPPRRGSA